MSENLAERVIRSTNWSQLAAANGPASQIGESLGLLLTAATPEEASTAYWRLENHVVVQGELFESAEQAVAVVVAAFADPRPRHVRISMLELLYQILRGLPSPDEIERGNADLLERCRARTLEGLWLLVHEAMVGEHEAVMDVLELILDGDRIEVVRSLMQVDDGTPP